MSNVRMGVSKAVLTVVFAFGLVGGLTGCSGSDTGKKDITSKNSSAVGTERVPKSLQFLIAKKSQEPSAVNENLNFTCAKSISYSLTTLATDVKINLETGLRDKPVVFEVGPASTIDEFRFGRYNTMPYASKDVATEIIAELESRNVFPQCKSPKKGHEINITFIEAFHLEGSGKFLPKHVKTIEDDEGVIQIAIVLGYRQLIRDYISARTDNFKSTNHHFTKHEFYRWGSGYHWLLSGWKHDRPNEDGQLISVETVSNSIPSDILEFFQNTPGRTIVGYGSTARAAFRELQDRSVPVYTELMTGLIQEC
ncbi:MAG: hypothetical protein ABJG88_13665, partial [Litorimonas sp.]